MSKMNFHNFVKKHNDILCEMYNNFTFRTEITFDDFCMFVYQKSSNKK